MTTHRDLAPLAEALALYRDRGASSFHVPGHKNGRAYEADRNGADMLHEAMRIDVTEIAGTDDLFHPEGVIQDAQELAADCFGAEESFFLVGGSTAGNLALILTVCREPGDIVLVQRNVHKSVLNGLMLAGARAVFLQPEMDKSSGLAVAPSAATLAAALEAYPEARGAVVTMPNYYGMGSDLRPLAEACHEHEIPLLVDEAHGAHYGQHPRLPMNALSCGADGVVQSTHKMLAAMTMGAMLHVQGGLLDRSLLRQRLAMVQSSSPSYPLMASLDLARRLLHTQSAGAFTAGLAAVDAFRRGLAKLPRFGLLQPPQPGGHAAGTAAAAYTRQDPFKAVIYDRTGSLSGYALQRALEARGCVPEMSDELYVVLLFTLGSTQEDANHVLWALVHIVEQEEALEKTGTEPGDQPEGTELLIRKLRDQGDFTRYEQPVFRPEENLDYIDVDASLLTEEYVTPNVSTWNNLPGETPYSAPVPFSLKPIDREMVESVPIESIAGRTVAEMVIPYPPGIPILYPGEVIAMEMAQRMLALREAGAKCQGIKDPTLASIVVFKEL
ncbi:aminotransferase class I/II-fold pyridoxal phosphate-dependent enzyme [Paenibacillus sp. Cedars]|uniref:aminotransferase class I/II-fold pyridoxal phosphate-dependent enzyme n=1 Tax=Paenibacillus sp. Cedars TaxID=1980674 RepID=UPI0011646E3C|nr:aminotransferase class I/II-fold pyridoxal phosphate-dependent enzyme [Paenibacillus sp. Cedars]AWP30313.1 amino acid decarboxylase [Paenibacillus sp. Cedars]